MKISSVKIISLLFFVLSAFYLYTAHQIQVFSFDENAPFNAKTFPIYLGYAGMFLAGLKIFYQKNLKRSRPQGFRLQKSNFLIIIMIFYGLTILKSRFLFIYINFFTFFILFFGGKEDGN